ncbi:hypothetical protein ACA910_006541 [Epithemia clementina (nom. ined.)]
MHLSFSKKIPPPTAVPGEILMIDMKSLLSDMAQKSFLRRSHQSFTNNSNTKKKGGFSPTYQTTCALVLGLVLMLGLILLSAVDEHHSAELADNSHGGSGSSSSRVGMSQDELLALLQNIKGQDRRLFRWDATQLTMQRRNQGGCTKLPKVAAILIRWNAAFSSSSSSSSSSSFLLQGTRATMTQQN